MHCSDIFAYAVHNRAEMQPDERGRHYWYEIFWVAIYKRTNIINTSWYCDIEHTGQQHELQNRIRTSILRKPPRIQKRIQKQAVDMQFSTIFAIFTGLTLVAARPTIPAALQVRVEECSCSDAQNAYAVCLLESCGHGCTDEDAAPCVASVGTSLLRWYEMCNNADSLQRLNVSLIGLLVHCHLHRDQLSWFWRDDEMKMDDIYDLW